VSSPWQVGLGGSGAAHHGPEPDGGEGKRRSGSAGGRLACPVGEGQGRTGVKRRPPLALAASERGTAQHGNANPGKAAADTARAAALSELNRHSKIQNQGIIIHSIKQKRRERERQKSDEN
jgi:hypothetical protein